jgi:large subunit ribosomal protein L54
MLRSLAGPAKTGQLSTEVVTGVAIRKGESDPPILPDSEYPAWLFELMKPEPSVAELERMYKAEGLELHQVGTRAVC